MPVDLLNGPFMNGKHTFFSASRPHRGDCDQLPPWGRRDDELYEFDQLCLERPEEVLINELDDSPRKPESSLPR